MVKPSKKFTNRKIYFYPFLNIRWSINQPNVELNSLGSPNLGYLKFSSYFLCYDFLFG